MNSEFGEQKMLREEKPEAFASPEQNPEDGSSKKKKKKRCRWRKKKKINENPNPQPQVCSEPLVVDAPISELKSNEESVTLPDSNNIATKKKRKKNRNKNKNKSMINAEEPKPALELGKNEEPKPALELGKNEEPKPVLELEKNEEPKPALELEKNKEVESIAVAKTMTRKRKRKSVQNGAESNEHNIEQAETAVQMSILDTEVPPIDKAIAVNNQHVSLDELEERYFERKKTRKERRKEYLEMKKLKSEGEVKTNGEEKTKNDTLETLAQRPFDPITEPSADPAVVMDTHPATPIVAEQKIAKKRHKKKKRKREAVQYSIAETSVQGTKGVTVTNAPNGQHGQSSMLCWACRETDHTIQQCRKLKSLSKDEDVCFFCGEIGHSLGKCSVYIAGGGRLARCLFCNAHGHFSYNCPGNCHDPKVL
ncbi:putative transcription factor interactor and regulator CCHC(Zn) family [Medicago truncatula]|uniref:Putative transcription factor interactor and regulator CCHC(Zn) family n=1 Tax=Medicago truncatula TaxID=3880 RepID=A0A396K1D2_MEDTR|nr:putative transcription factor interactor and regulator CCHC(Zn) family [Medicago truncatula]